ncbi:hypothetical protein ACP70R_024932 [Stipagrostis hirtigluma subsp. patula]
MAHDAGAGGGMEIVPHSGDLELELPPLDVLRQDSLYRDATRPAHGGHHGQESWFRTLQLAFQCVGILYADLGTSPLYVYANTFKKGVGHEDDVLGVLSIIIYSFVLFTMIKIVFIALYANDEGDGGTFALYSLISRYAKVCLIPNQQAEDELVSRYKHHTKPSATLRRAQWMKNLLERSKVAKISLFFLTILATALAISDCMLTPPISVLAAVNGLKLRAPHLTTDEMVWITVGILVLLFAVQRFGTDKIGYTFAPVVALWLLFIAGIGIFNLVKYDVGTLKAFNPKYIIDYFRRNKKKGWVSLGEILLCFTGTEALFADLGYFSIRSIQLSFTFGLLPSVLLAYIGQAAYLRKHMGMDISNIFFNSIPSSLFWPTFILALIASVIGSQAMISCAFATMSHLQALNCFPRVKILHTSRRYSGQLYIPEVNIFLCISACVVTISFRTTGFIAKAHEICVVLVMVITTLLMTIVMLLVWKVSIWWIAIFFIVFMSTESIYTAAVLYKFTHGPYLPLAMSAVLMVIMIVWHYVHVKRYKYELQHTVSRDEVKDLLENRGLKRVPGLGLFYTELVQGIPPIFPHLIEKIPTIHSVIVFITVKHLPIPHVDVSDRFLFRQVEPKEFMVFRCVARYGYRDTLEMAHDFVTIVVEYLQYYIRDINLYGIGDEPLRISYHSARVDSSSWDKPTGHGIYAEEMLTPIQSFSELTMHPVGMSNRLAQFQTGKMNLEEILKIEEDQKVIQREVDNGVVYIVGESEVIAKPGSNLLKKIVVNYLYNFLRKNSRNGEKMLSIPRGKLLKVGITYEI